MEEKDNRMTIDDHIIVYTYYLIKNALRSMEVMTKVVKKLNLDGPDFTKEQKRTLKADLGFTSNAIYHLGQAQDAFRKFTRSVGVVEQEMDRRSVTIEFDRAQSVCSDLMAVDLVYLALTEHRANEEKRSKIHRYLKKFKWDGTHGLDDIYKTLEEDSERMMDEYVATLKRGAKS